MRNIRSGRFKDALDIQKPTVTSDEYGGQTTTWATSVDCCPCDIRPLRASEFYKASGENVHNIFEIHFRYEDGLLAENMRLLDTNVSPNRVFDIQAIIDFNNWNSELVVTALERKWPLRD